MIERATWSDVPPARPPLRPGDPVWRARWLASVLWRGRLTGAERARVGAARAARLGADAALWARLASAEAAYAGGQGEWLIPGHGGAGRRGAPR
jgi:hypothetical protein